eukprot:4376109-Karenia_brevis.AAC.1
MRPGGARFLRDKKASKDDSTPIGENQSLQIHQDILYKKISRENASRFIDRLHRKAKTGSRVH